MGIMIFAAMVAGWVIGLAITALLGAAGVGFTIKLSKGHKRVWWFFVVTFVVILPVVIIALQMISYPHVRPGSDYDIAMRNLFFKGLGYCAAPGLAALCAGFATRFSPKKT